MDQYSKMCRDRFNELESKDPAGSDNPIFTRLSKDLKYVEIVVSGIGAIYKKKIGGRDPSIVETEVKHHCRDHYKIPIH
jgi:hypothetical protein